MTKESKKGYIELFRTAYEMGEDFLSITKEGYTRLVEELWHADVTLRDKYLSPEVVPEIKKLFGVDIHVLGER